VTQNKPSTAQLTCDFLIVGSGAAGLTAAIAAAHAGLDVLVVEKEAWFGGASARSGGGLWIPGNSLARRAGITDSRGNILNYLRHEAGALFDEARVGAFLDAGPRMVDFVEARTYVKFFLPPSYPDYHASHPGGSSEGRSVFAKSMHAAALGEELKRLRRPMAVSTFLTMPIGLEDAGSFMTAGRNAKSLLRVCRLLLRLLRDVCLHGRTMRLAMGNALVGGLAASAFQRGVKIWTSAPARSLLTSSEGAVTGAVVDSGGRQVCVTARKGVLLCTGGFPHDSRRRSQLFPLGCNNAEAWALLPYGNTGDGLRMGESVGGYVEDRMAMPVALAPVSRIGTTEGALTCFPVFGSRATPGSLAVKRNGRRFVDEASSYHDFARALLQASAGEDDAVAYIIADHYTVRRYGLGRAHPFPLPLGPHLKSGYLLRADTLAELAGKAGIEPTALAATVEEFNGFARSGKDLAFGRGSNAYDRRMGDPAHAPNPCLGPIDRRPFYALRVVAGAVGTFAGLVTDRSAQVLRKDGTPIGGLYAAGNDLSSITGGDYIGGGCTLGPAMTFGYLAARHAAGIDASGTHEQ
jgi:succinate dehydrogenase/fumarate reductase flavoprotein subunit